MKTKRMIRVERVGRAFAFVSLFSIRWNLEFGRSASRFLCLALLTLFTSTLDAQRLSPLADKPEWTQLEDFQETMTREDFQRLLDTVYAPGDAARGLVDVAEDCAIVRSTLSPAAELRLRFARDAASAKAVPRFWKPAAALGPVPVGKPLAGVKIALDAGHIGGEWARMEERFFQIDDTLPVVEGDMTLRTAGHLARDLEALGASVSLVRKKDAPETDARPTDLRAVALEELARQGVAAPRETYDPAQIDDPGRAQTVQWQSEMLFYRISEIRRRARIVNDELKPDLVVCLHFNAEAWGGDPAHPQFVPRNHLHVLVNGCYSAGELRNDDVRFEMLVKLLSHSFSEELAASEHVAAALAQATKLPPYQYTTDNAVRVGESPYLWARNLLANRLYRAPTLFLEPYVMNNQEVWERVQAGDYEGEKRVAGVLRPSIYREYADAVAAGLRSYFAALRIK